MQKNYPSNRIIKKKRLYWEKRLGKLLKSNDPTIEDKSFKIYVATMLYFSFRLKRNIFAEEVWCDGVENLRVSKINGHNFSLSGDIAIVAVARDEWTTYKLQAQLSYSPDFKKVDSYQFLLDKDRSDQIKIQG